MHSPTHQYVANAVNSILDQVPDPEICGDFYALQFKLIQESRGFDRKDLVEAAIKDAWFLGHWALENSTKLSIESAQNLVYPATRMRNLYWRWTKQELSTAIGMVNPAFMDISPTMLCMDELTDVVGYNEIAIKIIERNIAHEARDPRIREKSGCPHGAQGMSRFLLRYLDFMNTHIVRQQATTAA